MDTFFRRCVEAGFRVAHASRVLAEASPPQRTSRVISARGSYPRRGWKFVSARRRNQHARRVCYPEFAFDAPLPLGSEMCPQVRAPAWERTFLAGAALIPTRQSRNQKDLEIFSQRHGEHREIPFGFFSVCSVPP